MHISIAILNQSNVALFTYLELLGVCLEGVDLDDLLEAVEADEDEAVVELGGGRLRRRHLVQEEAVERERLLVDHVLHPADVGRTPVHAGVAQRRRSPGGVPPVLAQGGLLKSCILRSSPAQMKKLEGNGPLDLRRLEGLSRDNKS